MVGGTDTIIFAHGQDLADWHDYTTDNESFNYLSSQGFHFYCNVDSSHILHRSGIIMCVGADGIWMDTGCGMMFTEM